MSEVIALRRPADEREAPAIGDEGLAYACAGGDPAAVGALFDRFHRPVTRYLRRLVADADVEDAVQTVFLQVARGKAAYDGRASVTTWLFAIATNVARHHRRSFARRARLGTALRSVAPREGREQERLDARAALAKAEAALRRLRPALREAFVLCELEGLSAGEAAHALGTSEAAVWKRVSKARKALRAEVLGPRGGSR